MSWVLHQQTSTIIRHNIQPADPLTSIAMRNRRKMRNLSAGSQYKKENYVCP
jgi:hypothetical protein